MENFFGVCKKEMFYGHEYEFKTIEEYIEWYNNERIIEKLKGLSSVEYRNSIQSNTI